MARPEKIGLDYFPLDVDIFEDEKIEAIAGEFGSSAELAVIKLLCAIYKKGYFIYWNELVQAQLLKRLPDLTADLLNKTVNRLVEWNFFDKQLFESEKILTSYNIQAVFFEATKRRKIGKPTQFVINVDINTQKQEFNEVNADINTIKSEISGINVDISTQSKVKESKVNKSKGKESKGKEIKEKESKESSEINEVNTDPLKTNSLFSNYFEYFLSLSRKNQSRRAMALQEFLKLPSFDQEKAVVGAKNYTEWYPKENKDDSGGTYSINAYQFIIDMEFKNYQEARDLNKKEYKRISGYI